MQIEITQSEFELVLAAIRDFVGCEVLDEEEQQEYEALLTKLEAIAIEVTPDAWRFEDL